MVEQLLGEAAGLVTAWKNKPVMMSVLLHSYSKRQRCSLLRVGGLLSFWTCSGEVSFENSCPALCPGTQDAALP